MEHLLSLAIFGSFMWFCIVLAALLITFFWSESVEHGGIAFIGVVAFLILNHFWGNVPVRDYISTVNVLIYLGLGLIYAVIRTYFYGRNSSERDIAYLKGNVFRWWFIFPISLISWIVSDLCRDLWNWVYDLFQGMFEYFFKLGQKAKK